ncbi:hypothetical protein [Xylella fastidiosa]|uniref:hypothetical protein n=1 Tax=Xylella fastidiosa TaxID=2371 RepID=UPI001E2DD33B|nr:hypothetical protein [Xylella fastidiosa]
MLPMIQRGNGIFQTLELGSPGIWALHFTLGAAFSNAAEAFYCRQRHSVESIAALRPIQCIECSAKAVFIDEWIRRNGDSVDIVNGWSK